MGVSAGLGKQNKRRSSKEKVVGELREKCYSCVVVLRLGAFAPDENSSELKKSMEVQHAGIKAYQRGKG